MAIHKIAIHPIKEEMVPGAIRRPQTPVNTTNDITLGFRRIR
jgi:hypothetical protein